MNHRTAPRLPTRRQFLGLLASASAFGGRWRSLRGLNAAPRLFEEIPSSISGITWAHDNAMSANRYLPETMGPGVAFFDPATKVDRVEIKWPLPSGRVERITDLPLDRYVTIVESEGRVRA